MRSLLKTMDDHAVVFRPASSDFGRASVKQLTGSPRCCTLQTLSDSESAKFSARGLVATHALFFVSNPQIESNDFVRVDEVSGDTTWIRVLSSKDARRPNGTLVLWRVVGEEIESAEMPEAS